MTSAAREDLLETLAARSAANMHRHPGLDWGVVEARLAANPGAVLTLAEMERTGGEPDVIGGGHQTGGLVFCDCSPESPAGRRSP